MVFEAKSLFDSEEFSDVQIKIGEKVFKCHKVVLCRNSEYFKALCGPQSRFQENTQAVIELYDDDPAGAEAVLRYIYDFSFSDLDDIFTPIGTMAQLPEKMLARATVLTNIHIAAQKYQVSQLAYDALGSMTDVLLVYAKGNRWTNVEGVKILEMLMQHGEDHGDLKELALQIARERLWDLFGDAGFRSMLETEPWKDMLEDCKEVINRACRPVTQIDLAMCGWCNLMWEKRVYHVCPRCGSAPGQVKKAQWV